MPHQSKRRQEKREQDGTSKHTKKDGRHTSKYINNYNKYKWTKCTMKTDSRVIIDDILLKC